MTKPPPLHRTPLTPEDSRILAWSAKQSRGFTGTQFFVEVQYDWDPNRNWWGDKGKPFDQLELAHDFLTYRLQHQSVLAARIVIRQITDTISYGSAKFPAKEPIFSAPCHGAAIQSFSRMPK